MEKVSYIVRKSDPLFLFWQLRKDKTESEPESESELESEPKSEPESESEPEHGVVPSDCNYYSERIYTYLFICRIRKWLIGYLKIIANSAGQGGYGPLVLSALELEGRKRPFDDMR